MTNQVNEALQAALWRVYNRSQPARPWEDGENLPWNDPDFSQRMLREHLDQSHGAASRQRSEILRLVDWLWGKFDLAPGARVLDITCGPGLYAVEMARRGARVTGIDFGPASIQYARDLAAQQGVADRCTFIQSDVRDALPEQAGQAYDAALFIYGQLSVFTREETATLLRQAAAALRPGGRLAIELLNYDRIDKTDSNFWFTDDRGLWGDRPFLVLGERFWNAEERTVIDRFNLLHLETGKMEVIALSDCGYETEEMLALLQDCGFSSAEPFNAWNSIGLYDEEEWIAYIATR